MLQLPKGVVSRATDEGFRLDSAVLDCVGAAIYLVRADNPRIVYTNSKLDALFGYEPGELLGQHVSTINAPAAGERDGEYHELIISSLIQKREWSGEVLSRRKDGSLFWCLMNASVLEHPEYGTLWLGARQNIHDRKLAEAALEAARLDHRQRLEQQVAERTAALQEARDSLERRVAEGMEQVRRLAAEVTFAEERERHALARNLHDDLGQLLHVVKIKLEMLARDDRDPKRQSLLGETGQLVSAASRLVRSLTSQLSPPVLSTLGLPAAIRWLCEEIQTTYGLSVSCWADIPAGGLSSTQTAILFRAGRELLINAARHSGSNHASIELTRLDGSLTMTVVDSGNGSQVLEETLSSTAGFGLTTVRERISYLGGTMKIHTPAGGGLHVTLQLPIEIDRS